MTLLTTEDAAFAATVTPATIRKWAERGYLTPRADSGPRWCMAEVYRVKDRRAGRLAKHLTRCHAAGRTTGSASEARDQ